MNDEIKTLVDLISAVKDKSLDGKYKTATHEEHAAIHRANPLLKDHMAEHYEYIDTSVDHQMIKSNVS